MNCQAIHAGVEVRVAAFQEVSRLKADSVKVALSYHAHATQMVTQAIRHFKYLPSIIISRKDI